MDRVHIGHHLPVDTRPADDETALIGLCRLGGFLFAVHHLGTFNLRCLTGKNDVMPAFQRLAPGKILQGPAPDQNGSAVRQLTKVSAVGFQDDLLGALAADPPVGKYCYNRFHGLHRHCGNCHG